MLCIIETRTEQTDIIVPKPWENQKMRLNDLFHTLKVFMPYPENKILVSEDHFNNNLPDRIVAQVKELKDIYALLKLQGQGDILAKVDIPVKIGEYLLLQFKNLQNGKYCYKVIKRSPEPIKLNEEENISFIRLLIKEQGEEVLVPVMIRHFSNSESEKDNHDKKTGKVANKFLLDFVVETSNLGLMIIQFERKDDFYFSQILVESEKIGTLFERELEGLQTLFQNLKERNIIFLKWDLIPTRLKEEISRNLLETGFRLDIQV
jgi:hypothetical protein